MKFTNCQEIMVSILVLFMVSSLTFFSCVKSCNFNCPDKPVLTPSRLVVKYGDPTSATCVACQKDCLPLEESVIDMEASVGNTAGNGTTFTWTVNHMNEWDLTPKCFYTNVNNKQCCSNLAVTVYQPPENVSFSLNHTGPLTEGAEVTLQCSVLNVAPAENLTVTFYRGQTPLGHMTTNNSAKKPVSETFSLSYNTSKEDNGAEFWCEAKLELGAEGPQPPLVVKSEKLDVKVHWEPKEILEAVSFSFVNSTGQLLECGQNTLQCFVLNVFPAENLTVTFYRGLIALGHMKSTYNTKEPVNETFTLQYNISKDDDGSLFWCGAALGVKPGRRQPTLVVESENLTAIVHCKPEGLKTTSKPTSDAPSGKLYRFILCLTLLVSASV